MVVDGRYFHKDGITKYKMSPTVYKKLISNDNP